MSLSRVGLVLLAGVLAMELGCSRRSASREDAASTAAPARVSRPTRGAVFLAATRTFACAALHDGRVVCWGGGGFTSPYFGDGTPETAMKPVVVPAFRDVEEVRLGAHGQPMCALSRSGDVTCIHQRRGLEGPAPVTKLSGATQLAIGINHVCARTAKGQAYCWGDGGGGAIGDGSVAWDERFQAEPRLVPGLAAVAGVVAGFGWSCAWQTDGAASCWGNGFGPDGREIGTLVRPPRLQGVIRLAAAKNQVCGLRANGSVRCSLSDPGEVSWGGGALRGAVAVATSNLHACAITRGGEAFCWGEGARGILGDGQDHPDVGPDGRVVFQPPKPVLGVRGAVEIDTDVGHACARTAAGEVLCWGSNGAGELGDGTSSYPRSSPVRVRGLPPAVQIAVGGSFTCALAKDGDVWCWGESSWGQMGNGTAPEKQLVPVKVSLPE